MQPEPRPVTDVSVVIVSLNTRDLLATCLRTVRASRSVTFEVWVVDNGSSDGSADMVTEAFPEVRLIRNGDNRGFAAANNLAIQQSRSRYVLLLNPDTEIQPETLSGLVCFMDGRPDAGMCGPKLHFPDGRFQSCGYRFPTLLSEIRQSKNLDRMLRPLVGAEPQVTVSEKPFEVDWVDGACLLVRREVVAEIGVLDEQYFLYAEELDWCHRARKAGWCIYGVPTYTVVHHQGQSSAQMSDFSLAHLVETRLRYYRKHHGLSSALMTSLVYVAGALRQVPRSPHKQRVKLRATLRWWRSLLPA